MPKMRVWGWWRRRLADAVAALALVVFVAVLILWWRSHSVVERWDYASAPDPSGAQIHFGLQSEPSTVTLGYAYPLLPQSPGVSRSTTVWSVVGFQHSTSRIQPGMVVTGSTTRAFVDQYGSRVGSFGLFAGNLPWSSSNGTTTIVVRNVGLLFPQWSVALAAGAVIAWRGWAIVRRRRRIHSDTPRCVVCGYDLRATPDRCPECGQAVAT